MALQVWLPLEGNLTNQGVSGLTFSNLDSSKTAPATPGRLSGNCYANSALDGGGLVSSTTINLGQNQSMFCWMKFTELTSASSLGCGLVTNHRYPSNCGMGITIKYVSTTTGYLSVSTGNGSGRTYNTYCGGTLLQANTWYHVGYTYDGSTIRLYVNGVQDGSATYANMKVIDDYIALFAWSMASSSGSGVYSGYKLKGSLADVRVYDHCLSAKEVRELSKGITLHYKLSDAIGYANLAGSKSLAVYNNFSGSGTTGSLAALSEKYQGATVYRLTMVPNSSSISSFQSTLHSHGVYFGTFTFSASTKYASWIYYRPVTHTDIRVGGTASNIGGWTEIAPKKYSNEWYVVGQCRNGSVTSDKSDNIFYSFYSPSLTAGATIQIDFCCPHLISGATEIIDNGDFSGTREDSAIEFDCSGYNRNGTRTGTHVVNTDSAKYTGCRYISENATKVKLPAMTYSAFGNSYTIAWWEYAVSGSSNMPWGFSDGNRLNCYHSGNNLYWNTGDGGSNPFKNASGTVISCANLLNGWHHFAVTGNGSAAKLYIDGAYMGSAATYKALTGTQVYISGWDTGTSYTWTGGRICDFRVYATCMSDADVLELCRTAASVDSNGNLFSFEVVE